MWQNYQPTKIVFGAGVLEKQPELLGSLGKKALVVTGRGGSARRNGALADVSRVLQQCNIAWELFDQVEVNPGLPTVRNGARMAAKSQVDFVIGIGGGSPLDAAKAIAVLAVNDVDESNLFAGQFQKALPIAAIPTTAGTGSEVTPYSILTDPGIESKRNLSSPLIFPALAILDPRYTYQLPADITRDTAVDAYSHALEGYFSLRATPFSDVHARAAMQGLGPHLRRLASGKGLADQERAELLYWSAMAGMVISQTGSSVPHALGYALTYFKQLPHGRANGLLLPAFLRFNLDRSDNPRTREALKVSGFEDWQHFAHVLETLTGVPPESTKAQRARFIEICAQAKNSRNNIVEPNLDDLHRILAEALKTNPA